MTEATRPRNPAELLAPAADLARHGRLYPSVILHGAGEGDRVAAAIHLARILLCEREARERPCGERDRCLHCRRIAAPVSEADTASRETSFHPDFAWLERDLKTSTSAESTRELLRVARLSPFEARGQVFVIAEAASLSAEASDALLKAIEEPGLKAPRNFLLLAPSRLDLAPTLRSRSLAVYLGGGPRPDPVAVAKAARALTESFARAAAAPPGAAGLFALAAAAALLPKRLAEELDVDDPRAAAPWIFAASVARAAADPEMSERVDAPTRRRLLALAEELLTASPMRLRGISPERILEGLAARHLA